MVRPAMPDRLPEPLRLSDVADSARALGAASFAAMIGAPYVLVGSAHEPGESDGPWHYTTDSHAAPGAVPETALESAIVIPIKKARVDDLPGVVLVGRATTNDIHLDSPSVSKLHARIHETATGLSVSDAGSRNGTTLDGRPVGNETAIRVFAVIAFGQRSFTVQDTASLYGLLKKMR